tara:strand:- start:3033 stop:4301 length:1269 start_codon:yes stop_codon:yes gene_type:complete
MMNSKLSYRAAIEFHHTIEQLEEPLGGWAEHAWDVMTGRCLTGQGVVASAIEVTVSEDNVPLLRKSSGIASTFALNAIAKHLEGVDLMNDLEVKEAVRRGWTAFEDRKQLANTVKEGFGCDHSASWETIRIIGDDPKRAALVEEIARKAGRMHKSMSGVKQMVPDDKPEEMTGTELGGELQRLVPAEQAQLASDNSMVSDMATMRALEKRSTQSKLQGESECARGPLVLAIDESGSMHDILSFELHNRGSGSPWRSMPPVGRNTWAKSCAVALIRIAHDAGRMVRIVHFGEATAVSECAPGDHKAVLEAMMHFLSGGTDIATALNRSARQVQDLASSGWDGADIVFISDGQDGDYGRQKKIIEQFMQTGVKLWTVAIDEDIDCDSPLRSCAEQYVHVEGIGDDDSSADALVAAADSDIVQGR